MTSSEAMWGYEDLSDDVPARLVSKLRLQSLHFQIRLNELKMSNVRSAGAPDDADFVVHLMQRLHLQVHRFESEKIRYLENWPEAELPELGDS